MPNHAQSTSWNFKAIGLPPRLRESDVFLFRRVLSKGLPEVVFVIAVNRNFQKSQKIAKTPIDNSANKPSAIGSTRVLNFQPVVTENQRRRQKSVSVQ